MKYWLIICIGLSCVITTQAQIHLKMQVSGQDGKVEKTYLDSFRDSLTAISYVKSFIEEQKKSNDKVAIIDTIYKISDTLLVNVFSGEKISFGSIEMDSSHLLLLANSGLRSFNWYGMPVNWNTIIDHHKSVVEYLENNGYPFASVQLAESTIKDGKLEGKLRIDEGQKVFFNDLEIPSFLTIKKSILNRFLGIQSGDVYDRRKVNSISKKLENLAYLQLDSAVYTTLLGNRATVHLPISEVPASRFDFLIGVQPTTTNGTRNFTITGQFTGEMLNTFGRGEYIYAHFQRLRPETQQLDLAFKYPFIFNSVIGVDLDFGLFRNQNQFLELHADVGLPFFISSSAILKASWHIKSSRLIDIDFDEIITDRKLPEQLDVVFNGGGLELKLQNLDYRFNPTQGFKIDVSTAIGVKRILENPSILDLQADGVNYSMSYDSLQLNSFQLVSRLNMEGYIPVFRRGVIHTAMNGRLLYNQDNIQLNEFYRMGGIQSIRGFDEQSIITNAYLYGTLAFRLILDKNSFLSFPFVDFGYTKVRINEEDQWDQVLGFGAGLNFSTPAGIFNVTFAAGRRLNNPLNLGDTKVHFGYMNLF